MFASSKDPIPRRRSRPYSGLNKSARSSKFSLLSAFTVTSTGSSGSNSTITQESYSKSRAHYGKSGRRRRTNKSSRMKDGAILSNPKASVDVFDFLVEDDPGKPRKPTLIDEDDAIEDQSDPECYYRSHLSDSGISMGDSSQDGHDPSRHHLYPLPEEPYYGPIILQPPPEMPYGDRRWSWSGAPPAPLPMDGFVPTHHVYYDPPMDPHYNWGPAESTAIGTPSTAPDFAQGTTISVKDKTDIPERLAFRSFAKLTLGLLLQMQDEIAELEEELIGMDAQAESQSEVGHENSSAAGYDTQRRRVELYREFHFKLEHYQQALFNYHKTQSISSPVDESTSSTYRNWLEEHVSPSSRHPYLHGNDLRFFDSSPTPSPPASNNQLLHTIAISGFCNGVFPLLAFKMFECVLNRLILITCFTATCAMIMNRMNIGMGKEHVICVIAFSLISLCAALML